MTDIAHTVQTLCRLSREQAAGEWPGLEWPETLPEDAWFFSRALVSIAATGAFAALDEAAQRRLALLEALNFFSLNIHGERALIAGLSARLYRRDGAAITPYLHHFLDEENRHMAYFGEFCTRYGRVYPEKKLAFEREYADGEEDFLFFAKVMVFEEIVDVFNQRMAADTTLHPLARRINELHHKDELRHLAFGRQMVTQLWALHSPAWGGEVTARVRETLAQYFQATWREYANPDVYRDAGLARPHDLAREALESSRALRREIGAKGAGFLKAQGILETEPAL